MTESIREHEGGTVLHPPVEVLVAHGLELEGDERRAWLARLERESPPTGAEVRRRLMTLSDLGLDPVQPRAGSTPVVPGYRLEARVGAGGMGEVHTAIEEATGRRVALKWVRPDLVGFDTARKRFEREVRAIAALRHPGIVSILTVGEAQGAPWYAMEWLGGASLEEVLAELRGRAPGDLAREDFLAALHGAAARHPEPEPEAPAAFPGATYPAVVAGILARVAEALEHAHGQGILHRDLKPSNIVLTPAGRVVLVDFGLATAPSSDRLTRSGSWLGSLPYSSPEQIEGRQAAMGPASDVYGLGITLIELLTLRTPYLGGDEGLVRRRVLTGDRDSVRALNPAVPRSLARIAEAAADLAPDRRPASARELAQDLERFRLGRPVQARPVPWWLRLGRRARRSPLTAALIVSSLVFMVGSLAFGWRERALRTQLTRLSDGKVATGLLAEAADFWPARPDLLPAMDDWLERAHGVLARRTEHARNLDELRRRARPNSAPELLQDHAGAKARLGTLALELAGLGQYVAAGARGAASLPLAPDETRRVSEETHRLLAAAPTEFLRETRRRIAQVRARMERDPQWEPDIEQLDEFLRILEREEPALTTTVVRRFASAEDQWRHEVLLTLERQLASLESLLVEVEQLATHTRRLEKRFERDAPAWDAAVAAIANSGAYGGLVLRPLFGLTPLGENPGSGLWEFLVVESGETPEATPSAADPGAFTIGSESGVVLVLLPGGTFTMGNRPSEDDPPRRLGLPEHPVTLAPFLLSKYELTSAQAQRLAAWPAVEVTPDDPRLPFTLDWTRSDRGLRRSGLELPTEAQWEYAARAGEAPPASLEGRANVRDAAWLAWAVATGAEASGDEAAFDDGFARAAPVGSYLPNAFGLYDVFGNVGEWCRDGVTSRGYSTLPSRPGDGLKDSLGETRRAHRGGSWVAGPAACHAGRQRGLAPEQESLFVGLRPAMNLPGR